MAVSWPTQLQDYLNEDSFSHEFGNTTIRSSFDVGPAKVRRRFTRSIDMISCTIDLYKDDYDFFKTFYNTTLNGGVTPFEFNHPITQDLITVRFISDNPPSFRSMGGGYFKISMKWEILSE